MERIKEKVYIRDVQGNWVTIYREDITTYIIGEVNDNWDKWIEELTVAITEKDGIKSFDTVVINQFELRKKVIELLKGEK